jgi:serine protease AprX
MQIGVVFARKQRFSFLFARRIRVINLSLGRPVFESYTQDPLCQAVEAAWNAGMVVVVAVGNDGFKRIPLQGMFRFLVHPLLGAP